MSTQKKTFTLKKEPFVVEEQDWYLYEHYCIAYHQKTFDQEAWHWHHVPEEILVESGFIHSFNELRLKRKKWLEEKKEFYHPVRSVEYDPADPPKRREYGIDGLAREMDGDKALYHAIQCKYWATSRQLKGDDLGTFYQTLYCRMRVKQQSEKVNGYVYHTCRLQVDVRDDFKFCGMNAIKLPFDGKMKADQIAKQHPVAVEESKVTLYPYQVAALEALRADWFGCGLLHMPCGTGKTVVFLQHMKKKQYDHVFILSPLRVHTKQNLDRARNMFSNEKKKPEEEDVSYQYCLVDSDQEGTRDFEDILTYYQKGRCIYSSTFVSCQDVLSQFFEVDDDETPAMPKEESSSESEDDEDSLYEGSTSSSSSSVYPAKYDLSNSLVIVDEAHNVLGNKKLIQLIRSFPKVLLVTATPPCEMEEMLECQTLYSYLMSDAIQEKRICDYMVYLPWIHTYEGDEKPTLMMDIPESLEDLPKDLCLKALFLIKGMLEKGSRRCIVYLTSIEECGVFMNVFDQVMKRYHYLPYWISSITADTSEKDRERILKEFVMVEPKQLDRLYIMCSIRILDECVDIPECDSVFITNVGASTSDIRTVQRMCRANRLVHERPNKVANCFMWCEDHHSIVNALTLLRESDVSFSKKVRMISGSYDEKKDDVKGLMKEIHKVDGMKLLSFLDVFCLSAQEMWNRKKDILFAFCDEYQRVSKQIEEYQGIKIGNWFNHQKQKVKKGDTNVYEILSSHPIVKKALDRFLEKKKTEELSFDEKVQLLFTFCNSNDQVPKRKEEYQGIKIGIWFDSQKTKLRKGDTKIYETLSKHPIVKKGLDIFLEYQEKDVFDEKVQLLFTYCNSNDCVPKAKEEYQGIKIGIWFDNQKQKVKKGNTDVYETLSQHPIVKKELDTFLEDQKNEELSFDEKVQLLFTFCNSNDRTPKFKEEYQGIKIGNWFDRQKQKVKKGNTEVYETLSKHQIVKNALDTYLEKLKA